MNISIFGTGMVGQDLAARLLSKGHSVTIGTRDVQKTLALTGKNAYGMPAFGAWHAANSQIKWPHLPTQRRVLNCSLTPRRVPLLLTC